MWLAQDPWIDFALRDVATHDKASASAHMPSAAVPMPVPLPKPPVVAPPKPPEDALKAMAKDDDGDLGTPLQFTFRNDDAGLTPGTLWLNVAADFDLPLGPTGANGGTVKLQPRKHIIPSLEHEDDDPMLQLSPDVKDDVSIAFSEDSIAVAAAAHAQAHEDEKYQVGGVMNDETGVCCG